MAHRNPPEFPDVNAINADGNRKRALNLRNSARNADILLMTATFSNEQNELSASKKAEAENLPKKGEFNEY